MCKRVVYGPKFASKRKELLRNVRTADESSISGLRLRNVDLFVAKAGRTLPSGSSYEGRPLSSFSSGVWERPSEGRCNWGLGFPIAASSSSEKSKSAAWLWSAEGLKATLNCGRGLAFRLGGGEALTLARFALKGEARRDGGLECGLEDPDGGVTMVGVGVLEG